MWGWSKNFLHKKLYEQTLKIFLNVKQGSQGLFEAVEC